MGEADIVAAANDESSSTKEQVEGDNDHGTKRRQSVDFEEEDEEDISFKDPEEAKRAKADVDQLKSSDAPLGLLFAAFQRQMASEQSDPESENEENGNIENGNHGDDNKLVMLDESDDSPLCKEAPSVMSQFANFNGFSSSDAH